MAFTTDFSNVNEYAEFKAQDYEMVVVDAREEEYGQEGKKRITIEFVVRNDVDQEKKNAHLWDSHYKGRETGKYNMDIIMGRAKALGFEEGKEYQTLEAFLKDFVGRTARVRVKLEEYNGNENPRVHFLNPTKFPENNHIFNKPVDAPVIVEEDLPF